MQKNKQSTSNTKDLRLEVKNLLMGSLNHLKEFWGEKKFNNKVEEAAKLLTKGLKKIEKVEKADQKATKAVAKTKTVEDKKTIKKEMKSSDDIKPEVISKPKKSAAKKTAKKNPVVVSK